ncbi:uncharacterized protein MEPE_04869 [Melanopsichium pennsylvanicum]|uniref:Uncharacterized protein n=2 Tax=Melanopsichium pennsylvanicum TaxID=63383 RepID=A0AAJ5C6S2_9BASI|nr:putative protein [Melanopsichium pennsylvanicum 4]SNX86160.1 uncharacterized protein MEPE_04869 [Melanopsichium pennsylvanicum]
MSASRRAQIQSLCGIRTGPLIDRAESYFAAVDIWSRRGNQKAVKNAGTGVVAVCCYLAAESLDSRIPDRSTAIRASGLPPAQFAIAERDFRMAVQSVSNASSQTLSGPSDAFEASLSAAAHAARPIRPSPLKATDPSSSSSSSSSKEALLAKAQAVQAGSLFDQTMRAAPEPKPKALGKGKATETVTEAVPAVSSEGAAKNTSGAARDATSGAASGHMSSEMQPRRNKRRRMTKVVFGLAIHSSLNRLDELEEAEDQRHRRIRINRVQSTIEKLRSSAPTWRYLDAPRDFLVTISPSSESASPHL